MSNGSAQTNTAIHSFIIGGIALVSTALQACSVQLNNPKSASSASSSSTSAVVISPTSFYVRTNETYTLSATGGTAPYTYSIASGGGSIGSSSGIYTPPGVTGSASIKVTDSKGKTATSSATIGGAAGTIDTTFGASGYYKTANSAADTLWAVASTSSGAIFTSGQSVAGSQDFWAAKFGSTGSLDTTFNGTGSKTIAVSAGADYGRAIAIQTDGKIVQAGQTNAGALFGVSRLNTDGTLDTTFNTTGIQTFGNGADDAQNLAVILQTDGKIVTAGATIDSLNGDNNIMVARLTTTGALDTTFNGTGIATADVQGVSGNDWLSSVGLQSDGKIVVGGYTNDVGGITSGLLARYTTTGSLDTTFGVAGYAILNIGNTNEQFTAIKILSDDSIVATGMSYNGTDLDQLVAKYTASGVLDTSFNTTGYRRIGFVATKNDWASALAVQSDGAIVLGGRKTLANGTTDITVVRLTSTGALDASFGSSGVFTADAAVTANTDDEIYGIGIQADGNILAVGYANSAGSNRPLLLRVWY